MATAPESRRQFLFAASCLVLQPGSAALAATTQTLGGELRVVLPEAGPAERQVLSALVQRYPGLTSDVDPSVLRTRKPGSPYLCIGPKALERTLAVDLDGPIVSMLTFRETYARLLKAAPARNRGAISGVFAEASPDKQLQLIAAIFQRRVSVGVLLGPAGSALDQTIRRSAGQYGLELEIRHVPAGADIVRELAHLAEATVILAIPDSALYTPDNLKEILESTYRRGQPVVGFTPSMVTAGTLATAYASIDDYVADVAEVIDAFALGRMPAARYPKFWRVLINENVARSLDVPISSGVRNMGEFPPRREP